MLQKTEKDSGTLPNSFYEDTITLRPKPDKDITRKKTTDHYVTMWCGCKSPQQNSKLNLAIHAKWGLSQESNIELTSENQLI